MFKTQLPDYSAKPALSCFAFLSTHEEPPSPSQSIYFDARVRKCAVRRALQPGESKFGLAKTL